MTVTTTCVRSPGQEQQRRAENVDRVTAGVFGSKQLVVCLPGGSLVTVTTTCERIPGQERQRRAENVDRVTVGVFNPKRLVVCLSEVLS